MALVRHGRDEKYPSGFPIASGLPSWTAGATAAVIGNGCYRGFFFPPFYIAVAGTEKWRGTLALVWAVLRLGLVLAILAVHMSTAVGSCRLWLPSNLSVEPQAVKRGTNSALLTPLEARMAAAKKVKESFAQAKGLSDA
ncbi:Hypothetical predicted protein [Prunus dulcis]|uniref:Uncharacterized protein n=1 Tax=Prunus dulcis TaxID=3755 RepID=A0A5E4FM86_PRUDU|nr:hypothetical protein L3X38_004564 [Prunus dulcis]VVA28121.1 Hypothetical predicted protein [Prunus dulcis]